MNLRSSVALLFALLSFACGPSDPDEAMKQGSNDADMEKLTGNWSKVQDSELNHNSPDCYFGLRFKLGSFVRMKICLSDLGTYLAEIHEGKLSIDGDELRLEDTNSSCLSDHGTIYKLNIEDSGRSLANHNPNGMHRFKRVDANQGGNDPSDSQQLRFGCFDSKNTFQKNEDFRMHRIIN
jgi:hypothetical protein